MRVYLQTDIEGVAGVTFFENSVDDSIFNYYHHQRMRRLLTGEVNAAVKAAFDSGATEVVVNDNHGSAYNIFFEDLDPRCETFHGRANTQPFWLPEIDNGFDVMLLVGMHAMGDVQGANLPHSKWVLNGGEVYLSEGSMAAALAGHYGVKTIFVSGDQYVTKEIQEKILCIETAIIKKALGPYFARSMTPIRAQQLIYDGVCKAIQRETEIKPYTLKPPFRLNLLDSKGHIPPLEKILPEDVEGENIVDAFTKAVNSFPWNKFGLKDVDGFKYSGK
mgnify:CR=1 FL=1|jgi:D-amino peptidase